MAFPIIAIDGNAASGKGALARSLATRLAYAHLDTGALYRMIALRMIENGCASSDESAAHEFARLLRRTFDHRSIAPAGLKTEGISDMTSQIAAFATVRSELLDVQKEFARDPPALADGAAAKGAVLDGRDIGRVVCPDAGVKFFVTAETDTRAFRRFRELQQKGFPVSYEGVLAEIQERDARDAARCVSPMYPAEDALILDTTRLSAAEALEAAFAHVREILGKA